MMNLPSLSTMREWRLETLPLGRMMSLPCTRPIVTSGLSNSSRFDSPPFSLIVIANMPSLVALVVPGVPATCLDRGTHHVTKNPDLGQVYTLRRRLVGAPVESSSP